MTKTFMIAFAVMLLGAVTEAYYCEAIWKAWEWVPSSRVALLSIDDTCVLTLADIWSIKVNFLLLSDRPREGQGPSDASTIASETSDEDANV
jgi:hypothetical protein